VLAPGDPAAIAIEQLRTGGAMLSALRRAARTTGIDWRLARLVLIIRAQYPTRVADVAWDLGITTGAASKLCDRAEEFALIDKAYDTSVDRRETEVRLTAAGRELRSELEAMLRAPLDLQRPRNYAFGIRAYLEGGNFLDDL